MQKRILLIQGHPDAVNPHLCVALEKSYEEGALAAGHSVRRIEVASLAFTLLASRQEWEHGQLPVSLQLAQADIYWAQHIVFFFPLWMGDMPALLKGFLEQVARPGFALPPVDAPDTMPAKALKGRSAHVVVTMGMPGFVYNVYYRAHAIKAMKRNILGFVGIDPVSQTVVGLTDKMRPEKAQQWFDRMRECGRAAA